MADLCGSGDARVLFRALSRKAEWGSCLQSHLELSSGDLLLRLAQHALAAGDPGAFAESLGSRLSHAQYAA